MNIQIYLIFCVILISHVSFVRSYDSYIDYMEDGWKYPSDMVDDEVIHRERKKKDITALTVQLAECNNFLNTCHVNCASCKSTCPQNDFLKFLLHKQNEELCSKRKAKSEGCSPAEKKARTETNRNLMYMQRFVQSFLLVSELNDNYYLHDDRYDPIVIDLKFKISFKELRLLQKFTQQKNEEHVSVSQFDTLWLKILRSNSKGTNNLPNIAVRLSEHLWMFFSSKDVVFWLLIFALPGTVFILLLRSVPIKRIIAGFVVLVFAASYGWTYYYLYKKADVKQYLSTIKYHAKFHEHCTERPLSWTAWFSSFFFTIEKLDCTKVYEDVKLDPLLRITPSIVLSEMISSFMAHPSELFGTSINKFIKAILDNFSTFQGYVILIVVAVVITVMIVAYLFASFGGRFRMLGMSFDNNGSRVQEIRDQGAENRQDGYLPRNSGTSENVENVSHSQTLPQIHVTGSNNIVMFIGSHENLQKSGFENLIKDTETEPEYETQNSTSRRLSSDILILDTASAQSSSEAVASENTENFENTETDAANESRGNDFNQPSTSRQGLNESNNETSSNELQRTMNEFIRSIKDFGLVLTRQNVCGTNSAGPLLCIKRAVLKRDLLEFQHKIDSLD